MIEVVPHFEEHPHAKQGLDSSGPYEIFALRTTFAGFGVGFISTMLTFLDRNRRSWETE